MTIQTRTEQWARDNLRTTAEERAYWRKYGSPSIRQLLDDIDTLLAEVARLTAGSAVSEERAIQQGYRVLEMTEHLEAASIPAPQVPEGYVMVSMDVAKIIDGVFLPANPNKLRSASPETIQAAHAFKAAMFAASPPAPGDAGERWRPIAEAPPLEQVLLFRPDGLVRIGRPADFGSPNSNTHFMLLPPPPVEGE